MKRFRREIVNGENVTRRPEPDGGVNRDRTGLLPEPPAALGIGRSIDAAAALWLGLSIGLIFNFQSFPARADIPYRSVPHNRYTAS